jgi:hypothetical protein
MLFLDGEIRRLEAEFNMFFAGRLPRPPWETRARVNALVKRHDQSYIRNTADRFRFESLQTRYQKFLELWDRQMTNRELGKVGPGGRRTSVPGPPAPVSKGDQAQPDAGAVQFSRDQQLSPDSQTVKQLFNQLAAAKQQVGETPLAIDRLAALVRAQVDKFAKEGKDVRFEVATKDGKVTLTAKASDET